MKNALIFQAVENDVLQKRSYAYVDVSFTPANQFAPVLSSTTGSTNGVIPEDADIGDLVRAQFGSSTSFIRLTYSDQDYVSVIILVD